MEIWARREQIACTVDELSRQCTFEGRPGATVRGLFGRPTQGWSEAEVGSFRSRFDSSRVRPHRYIFLVAKQQVETATANPRLSRLWAPTQCSGCQKTRQQTALGILPSSREARFGFYLCQLARAANSVWLRDKKRITSTLYQLAGC